MVSTILLIEAVFLRLQHPFWCEVYCWLLETLKSALQEFDDAYLKCSDVLLFC